MEFGSVLTFALVTFVAVATPGPDVILAMANGSRFGMRKALAGMAGVLLSDLFLMIAVAAGLGAILATSEFWFSVVKYAGASYLAWLGYRMIRFGSHDRYSEQQESGSAGYASGSVIFRRSLIVAITNPKAYLFFSALLPQFINPGEPQLIQFVILTAVFSAVEFAILFAYAMVGLKTTQFAKSAASGWVEKGCGGALVVSAVSLALARRQD